MAMRGKAKPLPSLAKRPNDKDTAAPGTCRALCYITA